MPRGPRRTLGFGLFHQQSRQEMAESFPCCGVAPLFLAQYPQPCLLASFHSFAPMPGEERSLPSPHTLSCACGYSNISTPLLLVQQPLPSRAPGHLSSPVACKAPQPISADSLCPHPTPKGRAAVEEPACLVQSASKAPVKCTPVSALCRSPWPTSQALRVVVARSPTVQVLPSQGGHGSGCTRQQLAVLQSARADDILKDGGQTSQATRAGDA